MARNKINSSMLINLLKMTQFEVKAFCNSYLKQYGYRPISMNGFLYAEGDIPVALVAHMDTVKAPPKHVRHEFGVMTADTGLGADDRAGVYGILHLVNRGFRPTIILLEDEEIGCIGAGKFAKSGLDLDVNFFIELDRRGADDAVFYDCDNPEFTKFITSFGFEEQFGSFSDISEICPVYKTAGVNLSVGYYGEHTVKEILVVNELLQTLRKVENILNNVPNTSFEYIESVHTRFSFSKSFDAYYGYGSYSSYGNYTYDRTCNSTEIEYETFKILEDCVIIHNQTGEIIEVDFSNRIFFIDKNDNIYDASYQKLDFQAVTYDFLPMSYVDFN